MAEETGQEKTQEPTAKRIQDARKKGDIARSKELTTLALLMASAAAALMFGSHVGHTMMRMFSHNFSIRGEAVSDPAFMFIHLYEALWESFFSLWGFFLMVFLASFLSSIALGGWNFSGESLQPKGSRLNPLAGIKRMFSMKSLVELFKAIAKVLVVGSVSVLVVMVLRPELMALTAENIETSIEHALEVLAWSFLLISATMILVVLVDVPYQLYDYNKKLKMTMQEVKDEMKNTEGKPEVKGRIRQLQYEMSQRTMMKDVPNADVVITNPTHYAVAIKYDQSQGDAPVIIARGADFVALKIREIAQENDVQILSSPALARALFYATEVGDEVPTGLYTAVAQVLAYVYQLKNTPSSSQSSIPAPREQDLEIPETFRVDPE